MPNRRTGCGEQVPTDYFTDDVIWQCGQIRIGGGSLPAGRRHGDRVARRRTG
jgi:hypothetical protein